MELIDREHLLADVASLKQSPWFNRGKNEQFLHGVYLERKEAVETVEDLCIKSEPKVEAIPKPDYETQLKADMIVMLEELKEQLREMHEDFFETEHFDEAYGISDSMDVIQKRINDLVGKDGNIREKRQNEKSN